MKCTSCGAEVPGGSKFCNACGSSGVTPGPSLYPGAWGWKGFIKANQTMLGIIGGAFVVVLMVLGVLGAIFGSTRDAGLHFKLYVCAVTRWLAVGIARPSASTYDCKAPLTSLSRADLALSSTSETIRANGATPHI